MRNDLEGVGERIVNTKPIELRRMPVRRERGILTIHGHHGKVGDNDEQYTRAIILRFRMVQTGWFRRPSQTCKFNSHVHARPLL